MSRKHARAAGADAFEAHYAAMLGARWPTLRAALLAPTAHAVRLNPRHPDLRTRLPAGSAAIPGLPSTFTLPEPTDAFGEGEAYFLDPASVRVAALLDVAAGEDVLDLCAAPGGKSLVLADTLGLAGGDDPEAGTLHANELSPARRARLQRVLDGWLGGDADAAGARVFGHDGARWGLHRPASYDRVLVDAPCSSERHVLQDAAALAQWTPARPRQLAQRQVALLCAAVDSCRSGGVVVYATCALDEGENDGVVAKVLRKRRGVVELAPPLPMGDVRLSGAEATDCGWRWLPDAAGEGPIYVARLRVVAAPTR